MSTPLPNEIAKASLMPNTAKDCDCPTMCPKCGADLTVTANATPMPAMNASAMNASMPAPAKKGLLGIGFLGLGGRRRRTAHRRRRTTHRRARRNTRRNNRRRAH
jgi:hypothetical protein